MSFTCNADFDFYGHPEVRDTGELLEMVQVDAKRIMHLLGPRIGNAVVKQSVNGFHLKFPFARITEEEVAWMMQGSPLDSGYRYWCMERGSSTLRIGPKTIMKEVGTGPRRRFVGRRRVEDTPFVVEIIENPWSKVPIGYGIGGNNEWTPP